MRNRAVSLACAASVVAAGAPTLSPASASAAFGDRALRQGSEGRHVRVLQRWLTLLGVPTTVDGVYGRVTRRSVRIYERRNAMRVDGRVSRAQARGMRKRAYALQPLAQPIRPAPVGVLANGEAVAPAGAPPPVHAAVAAGNRIVGKPYKYGGGHGTWEDSGYDCSGTISYALHGAGLLRSPLASSGFTSYGAPGKGRWITVYAHGGHAYVVIAGMRLDTSGSGGQGPRWHAQPRSTSGFTARHPAGV